MFVPASRFQKDAMISTKTGKRSTFVTISPRAGVQLVIGCLPKDFDRQKRVCKRTTVQKEITRITAPRAAALRRKQGVNVAYGRRSLPKGTIKMTVAQARNIAKPNVRRSTLKSANPYLAVISNPVKYSPAELNKARRAYKRFHFTGPVEVKEVPAPKGWPQVYMYIGECERFDVQKPNGVIVSRKFAGKKPALATTSRMKDVYILGGRQLGVPSGRAVRVDYKVPANSGRNKWAPRYWHPHTTRPKVAVHSGGRAVKVSGPGLKVTPRGIEG